MGLGNYTNRSSLMVPNMEFNDLKAQYSLIDFAIEARLKKVFEHGRFVNGPEIAELEKTLADYVGVKHAIACGSGTDALILSLMALDIKAGDAVFTSAFSFVAAAEAIAFLGATPIFVDINPMSLNMAPMGLKAKIELVIEQNRLIPRAIIPVNLFGSPCDYYKINAIAKENELIVIEDMAQSFGAHYKGRKSGALGLAGCTSFFPSKPLGCYGDGGMIFTDNASFDHVLKAMRSHGSIGKYNHFRIGLNSRLDTIQAAILLEKFKLFENELIMRRANWHILNGKISALDYIEVPVIEPMKSACAQFPIICRDHELRQAITRRFRNEKIPYQIYYPKSLPEYQPYKSDTCLNAQDIATRIMALPFSPYMSVGDIDQIYQALKG
jgi:dTDP-4-amino-4,6-dideoxygalactose transaminase